MVTDSPFSTALISSGSLFLASATLTFIASTIAIYYGYVNSKEPVPSGPCPATSILIRARSVVQVHPGPPSNSRYACENIRLPVSENSLQKPTCQPFGKSNTPKSGYNLDSLP